MNKNNKEKVFQDYQEFAEYIDAYTMDDYNDLPKEKQVFHPFSIEEIDNILNVEANSITEEQAESFARIHNLQVYTTQRVQTPNTEWYETSKGFSRLEREFFMFAKNTSVNALCKESSI